MIALTAIGLLISTGLAGCASPEIQHVAPEVVAVPVRDMPPADLLACPQAAPGFPTDATATLPDPVRQALRTLVLDYRDLRARTLRLIDWIAPETCPAKESTR